MTEEHWQATCEAGRMATINALSEEVVRRAAGGAGQSDWIACLLGGLSGIAQMMGEMAKPERLALVEAIALASVRGPIRGFDGPVNEDGSPFEAPKLDGPWGVDYSTQCGNGMRSHPNREGP